MNYFDRVTIELQWIALYLRWVVIQAICLWTLTMYKYNEMQMSYATQKLNYKASCKTPFFHSEKKIVRYGKKLGS
jgi:hypothetical protein